MSINELNDLIDEVFGNRTDTTPYELAGLTSKVIGSYVREQMVYQYVSKGFIPSTSGTRSTKKGPREVKVILVEDGKSWVRKYSTKKLSVKTDVVESETTTV